MAKKYTERKREERASENREIAGIALIVISAFMLLCMIVGRYVLGDIGGAIANLMLGFIGYFTYPLFLFLLILGILKLKNRTVSAGAGAIACIVVIAAAVVFIAHLASSTAYIGGGFGSYIHDVYVGRNTVGGVLFSIPVYLLYKIFGLAFSYVIYALAIICAVFFLSGAHRNLPFFRSRNTRTKSKKTRRNESTDSFSAQQTGNRGLYVGSIIRPDVTYSTTENFDDLPPQNYERREETFDEAPYTPQPGDENYDRERARKILFEDNREAFDRYLPNKVTLTPDSYSSGSGFMPYNSGSSSSGSSYTSSALTQSIPDVPVPPRKYFESEYVAGEIINGDELAARINNELKQQNAQPESAPSPADTAPAPAAENEQGQSDEAPTTNMFGGYFNPGPIINGDLYEKGKKAPLVKMYADEEQKYGSINPESVYTAPKDEEPATPDRPAPAAQPAPAQTEPVRPTPPPLPEHEHIEPPSWTLPRAQAPKPAAPPQPQPEAKPAPVQPAPAVPVQPQPEVRPAPAPEPVKPAPAQPAPAAPVQSQPEVRPAPQPEPVKPAPSAPVQPQPKPAPEPEVEPDDAYEDTAEDEPAAAPVDKIDMIMNGMPEYDNLVDELEGESLEFETEAPEDEPEEVEAEEEAEEEPDEAPEQEEADELTSDEAADEADGVDAEPDFAPEIDDAEETEPESEEVEAEETEADESADGPEEKKSSFVISDTVEDLSERSYSNPNDTTGYYNQVTAPVNPEPVPAPEKSFDERVSEIEEKINPSAEPAPEPAPPAPTEEEAPAPAPVPAPKAESAPEPPKVQKPPKYHAPPLDLLVTESTHPDTNDGDTQNKIDILENALEMLGVPAKVNGVTVGPAITRYELDMPPGMSVKKIEPLAQDIRFNLACKGHIRIESPIPGKRAVGIEVPNDEIYTVALKDIIGAPEFKSSPSPLTIALGKDIQGKVMVTRLEKMPHLLIAGTTGSGKSSCLNSLLISLLYKASPSDVKIILIDPKQVEFTAYNGIPHMMIPAAITDVTQAINAFKWTANEMENRYTTLREHQVRDIQEYNASSEVKEGLLPKMPFIVLIVDEFANLITSSPANRKTLEELIMLIAAKARAAGIHLVLATQRPSVDVITGTIKANLPSRIAFAVANAQNSRIILDYAGAEALLGRGDMLFSPLGESDGVRIQGAYVENFEVKNIVTYVKEHNRSDFDSEFETAIKPKEPEQKDEEEDEEEDNRYDKELIAAVRCVIRSGRVSASMIQRRFRFGFNKAARIIEQMEDLHFIGPPNGANPREIYVTKEKFEEFFGEAYE